MRLQDAYKHPQIINPQEYTVYFKIRSALYCLKYEIYHKYKKLDFILFLKDPCRHINTRSIEIFESPQRAMKKHDILSEWMKRGKVSLNSTTWQFICP